MNLGGNQVQWIIAPDLFFHKNMHIFACLLACCGRNIHVLLVKASVRYNYSHIMPASNTKGSIISSLRRSPDGTCGLLYLHT